MIKDPFIFVKHIRDSIHDIEKFMEDISKQKFSNDDMRQAAVIRKIEIIGEAVKNIDDDFKKKYPDIAWKDIAGMRDKLIHDYFSVKMERVWEVIVDDIPKLKKQILSILKEK